MAAGLRLLVEAAPAVQAGKAGPDRPDRGDVEVVRLPCAALARRAGDDRVVSIDALGALVARRRIVEPGSIRDALATALGPTHREMLEADHAAFLAGYEAGLAPVIA